MADEADLALKLKKIEALFAGAATEGERTAAGEAAQRIRARLAAATSREPAIEMRFSIPDPWSRRLFIALCRRYRLSPYRKRGMKQQSVLLKAPRSFVENTLWPEFQELNGALREYLTAVTDKVIRQFVFGEVGEAPETDAGAERSKRRPTGP